MHIHSAEAILSAICCLYYFDDFFKKQVKFVRLDFILPSE